MSAVVSVIMPVYNVERFLRAAIDSVIAQTYPHWELILVDDGSTDSSPEICDRYAAANPQITVHHTANGGLSAARNFGLRHSSAPWVLFVDSDDMLHPQCLAIMMELQMHSQCEIVCAAAQEDTEPHFRRIGVPAMRVYPWDKAVELTLYQRRGMLNSMWGKLFARRLFDHEQFTEGILYEDLDMFYRLYDKVERVAATRARLYFYRMRSGSIIHTWNDHRADVLTVMSRMEAYMVKRHPLLLKAVRDRRLSATFNIFLLATANGQTAMADRCWDVIRAMRGASLFNPKVRFKNHVGCLISYLGRTVMNTIGRIC